MVSEVLKKQIDRFLLAFGFSLMFGIMILGQDFRQSVGEAVGVLMDPMLMLIGQENFHLALLIMAAITAIYASLIQKYTIDWELMRNTQERMKS
ncbi:MAG: EMC3/TMCO1 family protein, partial [Methanosarcina sp.]|nr:EMC3/TMCO1 family protein [Methanosarcina sp.]